MVEVTIRPAEAQDVARLNQALARLSEELGDHHRAGEADLLRHGFGADAAFRAEIAERGDGLVGAVLFSPVFSTTRGGGGLYVSDLWVADEVRGGGIARRLLAAACSTAASAWGARFLRLAVYDDNRLARAFYERLGFREAARESLLCLEGAALEALDEVQ
jgi:ribosomal protein S18 acetylase RimI-like enzyme